MFERFTDRSRRVLVIAQDEARLLNHGFIGTEHLLLGLIGENEGVAAKTLQSLDIELDAVRKKVAEEQPAGDDEPFGPAPFTPRAKKVLELSLREALQLGHNYIGTEHMLLGLIREGEGIGARVLVGLGADLSRVRQQVIQVLSGYAAHEMAKKATVAAGEVGSFIDTLKTRAVEFGKLRNARLVEAADHLRRAISILDAERLVTGESMIGEERARQITEEGWTLEHDDQHANGELRIAAATCYLQAQDAESPAPVEWPWRADWWKPKDRVTNLVRAGALFLAEQDRLQRTGLDDPSIIYIVRGIAADIDRLRSA